MSEVIRTEALTKRYHGVRALDGVSLQVPEGAIYALVGPNGAGKTTAIKILMNLISATSGSAEVLGMDSEKIRGTAYTRIGYISENQEIPEWMRVGELLEYLREFYPTWDSTLESSHLKEIRSAARPQNQAVVTWHENEAGARLRSRLSSQTRRSG